LLAVEEITTSSILVLVIELLWKLTFSLGINSKHHIVLLMFSRDGKSYELKMSVSSTNLKVTKTNSFYKSQITSVAILNKDVDKGPPCRNPFSIKNSLVGEPFTRIESFVVEIHYCIIISIVNQNPHKP